MFKGKKSELWVRTAADLLLDNGKTEDFRFSVLVKLVPFSEWKEWLDRMAEGEAVEEELISTFLLNWRLKGDDGDAIEFTAENVAASMELVPYRRGIVKAIMDANSHRKDSLGKR